MTTHSIIGRTGCTFALIGFLGVMLLEGEGRAATLYTHDAQNRLIQVTSTSGSSIRIAYDLGGNPTNTVEVQPSVLSVAMPVNVSLSTTGEHGWLRFTASSGQSVTLNIGSLVTQPVSSPITISVYNNGGALVQSVAGATSVALPSLPAGNYFVVIIPKNAATASMVVSLTSS